MVVLTLLLAGCGGNAQQSGAGTNANTADSVNEGTREQTVELTVSAAASLKDALTELQSAFEAEHQQIKLLFNFAASGALQQQIEQGAPADLFVSAAPKHINELIEKGMIAEEQHTDLLKNELVVVEPAGSGNLTELTDLLKQEIRHIAIGIPESVPAGEYARAALESAGLWHELEAKLVQAKDVRSVLQYVETGNADAGFVYRTDALSSEQVDIAFAAEEGSYPAVIYPVGIVSETKHPEQAEILYEYLQTDHARTIFETYGFGTAP